MGRLFVFSIFISQMEQVDIFYFTLHIVFE